MPRKKKKKFPAKELFLKDSIDYFPYSIILQYKGGDAYTLIDGNDGEGATIHIPMDNEFPEVVVSLLHELEETYLFVTGKRFMDTKQPGQFESINCVFMYGHDDLQARCHFIGYKLANIFPPLFEKWAEWKQSKEK